MILNEIRKFYELNEYDFMEPITINDLDPINLNKDTDKIDLKVDNMNIKDLNKPLIKLLFWEKNVSIINMGII